MKLGRRLSLAIAIISIIMLTSIDSYAGFYDGNALVNWFYEYEKSERNDPETDYYGVAKYYGYVIGVCDSLDSLLDIPDNVKAGTVCMIVGKYLKDNPEKWNQSADELVFQALQKVFPKKE